MLLVKHLLHPKQTVCMKEFDFRNLLLSTGQLVLLQILMDATLLFYSQILKPGIFKIPMNVFLPLCVCACDNN